MEVHELHELREDLETENLDQLEQLVQIKSEMNADSDFMREVHLKLSHLVDTYHPVGHDAPQPSSMQEQSPHVFPAGENFFYSAELLAMADRQLAAMYNTEEGYDGDDEDEDEYEDVEEVEDMEDVASDDYVLFFNDGVDILHMGASVFDDGIPKHIGQ